MGKPKAFKPTKATGRMLLRFPPRLHALVIERARAEGSSVNHLVGLLIAEGLRARKEAGS